GVVKQVRLQSVRQDNVVSYSVVISVDNPNGKLLPAMTATVEFIVARADDVLRVSNAALRFQPTEAMRKAAAATRSVSADGVRTGGDSTARRAEQARGSEDPGANGAPARTGAANRGVVWLISEDGTPRMVPVQTGLTDGQFTEVSGPGLEADMQVAAGTTTSGRAAAAAKPFRSSQQRGPRF